MDWNERGFVRAVQVRVLMSVEGRHVASEGPKAAMQLTPFDSRI